MSINFLIPEANMQFCLYWKRVLDIVAEEIDFLNFYVMPCYDISKYSKCPEEDAKYFKKNSLIIYLGDEHLNRKIPHEKAFAVVKNYVSDDNKISNIIPVPLGTIVNLDIPYIPAENREIDIFFIGQKFSCDGKTIGKPDRDEMWEAMTVLKNGNKNLNIKVQLTEYFTLGLSRKEYAECLANSKIALCPYGTNRETFRFSEAMKYGAVVASCELPHHWFYDNSPHIKLNNWFELDKIMKVLNDKTLLNDFHKSHLNWWDTVLSEKAMAKFIVTKVKKLRK
jgi:hypothetical protein